jgi:phage portal protein BeeE
LGLLERIDARRRGGEQRYSIDTWVNDYLIPTGGTFTYNGATYPFGQQLGLNQTLAGTRVMEVANSLPGYTAALRRCPPAFAAQMVRALILSQARFTFRSRPWSAQGKKTFGTGALSVLERPWPRATTGELLALMEWHAGLAGNAYVHQRGKRLRVLRPDWVGVIWGSESEPDSDIPGHALDGELLGYAYWNGGVFSKTPQAILPDEAAHWSPIPDPESPGMGMSWLTPAIRDMQSDRIMTDHKIKFFENGASPNLVIKGIPAVNQKQFNATVDMLEERHTGMANAYRTLYLVSGADATVVGSNLKDMEFKGVQGASETRISFLSRVPAPILGIAEGLAGSSLNAGNFGQARRNFGDGWVMPTLQNAANALSTLVSVPGDAELWPDTGDIGFLREDAKDAAEIEDVKARTIRTLVDGGFDPVSVVNAVTRQDMTLLRHSGLTSVQLLPPGSPKVVANGAAPPA